jgi:hypothetical protein
VLVVISAGIGLHARDCSDCGAPCEGSHTLSVIFVSKMQINIIQQIYSERRLMFLFTGLRAVLTLL